MAVFSWPITIMMAILALLVTSSRAIPVPNEQAIIFLDEQFHANPGQFRPPGLPTALPLEGEAEGRQLPQYPPYGTFNFDVQAFIDTQLHPMVQVYATLQRLEEEDRKQRLLKRRNPQLDRDNELA